jgi:predicted dienelactone hydrolase
VGYRLITATDDNRDEDTGGRTLPIHVWYPSRDDEDAADATYLSGGFLQLPALVAKSEPPVRADRRWPLVVFSHGYGGTPTQSTPLMETLASHGFIVAAVDHIGNSQTATAVVKDPAQAAADRVPDVSFVIDTLLAESRDTRSVWYRSVHPFHIGVTGHSFGGATSLGTVLGEFGEMAADPRVAAVVPVSAPTAAFSDFALSRMPVPALLLGGTLDASVPIDNNTRAFALNPGAEPAWNVAIAGATHTHFANICAIADGLFELGIQVEAWPGIGAGALVQPWLDTCAPESLPIARAQSLQNLYTVAFFKLHLQQDARYMRYLQPAINPPGASDLTVQRKGSAAWVERYKVW